jgi:hypothetical protein
MDFKHKLDIIDVRERTKFEDNYLKRQQPVIIKNLFDNQEINNWNFEFFRENFGNHEIGLFDSNEKYLDRSFKRPPIRMKFTDYLDILEKGPTSLRIFLFDPFKIKPELKKHFKFPNLGVKVIKKLPFMFFGGQGAITRIHKDMDMSHVFLTHLTGKKRVVLFHPKYSKLLYQYPFGVHSPVNIDKPDFERFPGLRYVKGHECILQNGETLFMPSGWWHHIEYIDPGFSISHRALGAVAHGLWQVSVVHYTDEFLRKMMGDKWADFKKRKARENADKIIEKIDM